MYSKRKSSGRRPLNQCRWTWNTTEMGNARETREIRDPETGRLIADCQYLNGRPDGLERIWAPNGALVLELHHRNGEPHGSYRSWWDDGLPKEEGTYHEGELVGVYTWYTLKGEVLETHDFGPPPAGPAAAQPDEH
jgi:antitoxin component YwqK of YwqJK toxin-antitoxin module